MDPTPSPPSVFYEDKLTGVGTCDGGKRSVWTTARLRGRAPHRFRLHRPRAVRGALARSVYTHVHQGSHERVGTRTLGGLPYAERPGFVGSERRGGPGPVAVERRCIATVGPVSHDRTPSNMKPSCGWVMRATTALPQVIPPPETTSPSSAHHRPEGYGARAHAGEIEIQGGHDHLAGRVDAAADGAAVVQHDLGPCVGQEPETGVDGGLALVGAIVAEIVTPGEDRVLRVGDHPRGAESRLVTQLVAVVGEPVRPLREVSSGPGRSPEQNGS